MDVGYSASEWTDFGVATVGATAALAGLLFVAVSINLTRILEFPNLPPRAAQTLILFALPLVTGLFLLTPAQPRRALAIEFVVTGALVGIAQTVIDTRAPRWEGETTMDMVSVRFLPPLVSSGCLVIAGLTLLARSGGGLYWLLPSVLGAIVFGLANAWVLLIEIQR